MGGNISANAVVWASFWYLTFVCTFITSLQHGLLLNVLPDISKINISIDEYTKMMDMYLQIRRSSTYAGSVPRLVTFDMEYKSLWEDPSTIGLQFGVGVSPKTEVESAQLKILAPPQEESSAVTIQVNQILGAGSKRLIEERTFYLSSNQTKWCDLDVTSALRSWMSGDENLGLELACLEANCNLNISNATISSLVNFVSARVRRSSPYQNERRTDCQKGMRKRKCCRQNMKVNFKKLNIPEMNYIIEPKGYEAGYCHGLCPPNYNHATNHSRIQSLMHQIDKSNVSKSSNKKRIVPKTCCVPSKLGALEILLVNKADPTKLTVEKWDNMIVIECACS